MCVDKEVLQSGECLYISGKNCVLSKCAFEEEEEDQFDMIEAGDSEKDEINIDKVYPVSSHIKTAKTV